MIDEPIHISDKDFENIVLKSDLPVIVDFWAVWCAPCKMIAPVLEKIAKEQSGKVIVAKVDVDAYSEQAMKYGVQGIPTMLFFYKGVLVHRQVGAFPEKILRTIISQFLEVVHEKTAS